MATKGVTLALQGGGAHGAFTWGVLDRLLEEDTLSVEGISGTSAGAMNAAVLADGLERGGREGARDALAGFWETMSRHSAFSPYRTGPLNPLGADYSPWAPWLNLLSQFASPYQLNPFQLNPLRELVEARIDFERLRSSPVKLFISATNVRSNRLRIFGNAELSPEVLLASACLPQLYQAVEIDGEHYWDGGYMGNPALEPLVSDCETSDIVIVQLNPTHRDEVPRSAAEIADRINEITFNSSLMREIRSLAAISRLVESGALTDPRYQRSYFHLIGAGDYLEHLGLYSKFDTHWGFLRELRDRGRARAAAWLAEHGEALGQRSSLDLDAWAPTYGHCEPPGMKKRSR